MNRRNAQEDGDAFPVGKVGERKKKKVDGERKVKGVSVDQES